MGNAAKPLDAVGGLLDVAVIGEADWIMARALLGKRSRVMYPGVSAGYRRAILEWQDRAVRTFRQSRLRPGDNLACLAWP